MVAGDHLVGHLLEVLDDALGLARVIRVIVPQPLGIDDVKQLHVPAVAAHVQIEGKRLAVVRLAGQGVLFGQGNGGQLDHEFQTLAAAQATVVAMDELRLHANLLDGVILVRCFDSSSQRAGRAEK